MANIDLHVCASQTKESLWRGSLPKETRPPVREAAVVRHGRNSLVNVQRTSPIACHLIEKGDQLSFRWTPRIVLGARNSGVAVYHDERGRAFRVGRRKQRAQRSAFRVAHQGGAFRAHRIHDGAYVVHALLQCRNLDEPVRQAGAALVKENEARKGCKLLQKPGDNGFFPQTSMLDIQPGTSTISTGPSPMT